ncbi:Mesothelin-like protein [Collichthys lucidus]|uniref:Mesothelin-like protein n=1 Tax=Collichthys lucidus TaxID=240159 RepID=A0A4V6AMG6_COLLU|nr:Mesothelin-like protein [Collichthys lucidus]
MQRLKGMLEATMDVYTFMRSSMTGVPILSLQGKLALRPKADPLQNEALVQMWLEAKMKPLLKSVTKHFLSCLSTKNFSCSTYQTVVREISHHFSEMDPVRQKWIYTFFMYPFLSGDRVAGCVSPGESSEDWLTKNFGAFRAMARMKDFSALNMVFSGLEVLHLLTPAQKAELLLRPEVASIDNGTLSLVFHSLLTGGSQPPPTAPPTSPGWGHNWTTTGYPPSYNPKLTYIPPPPQNSLQERNLSELRSTTLTQFLLNWTLSEVADLYRPQNASVAPEAPKFDVTNVEDWYKQVVMPLLRSYLDHGKDTNETSGTADVCSISLDKKPCGLTDAVENAAKVLHCAARTNLTMSEATIMRLITELTGRLNVLIQELSRANFTELASDFRQIFGEAESPSMTQEHLNDPNFIKLWFQIKLMPLLPAVPTGLLSCLSTKNFSCPVYQTIVAALSKHMSFMEADPMHSHNIYQHFIYSFLLHHNTSDAQCMSNHSAEWMEKNVGFFSRFAPITDFYRLYQNFSGLEVLHLLTPKQTAELLVLPLPTPPEKDVVVNRVFDFLLVSPKDRKFKEVLHYMVPLAKECQVTQYNDTNVCRGRNSSGHYIHMNTSMEVSCNLTLETYACAQLENFTANQLASLLRCNLPGKSDSKVLWKILLTKLSSVLDPALDILANMSMVGPSAPEILDVIGEMRVFMLTDEQLMNSSVIGKWFFSRLQRFLPSASGRFLHCLSSRNLSCHSYQQIVQIFIYHFDNMTLTQQHVVFKDFVLRFLSGSGQGCVSNNSAEWLMKNLGRFSGMLSVRELLDLNPHFNPLEVLHVQLLTPKQTAELLVLIHPTLPDKDALINMIFDHFNQSSDKKKFTDFLSDLVMVLQKANLSCSSYKTLFKRLDMAMAGVYYDAASSIIYTKMVLSKHLPPGCTIYSGKLSALKAEDLAAALACNRSYNSTSSRPVWKLFLSKASHVLDEALDLLANKTLDPRSPAVTAILDSIREIRLDAFSPASFNNPAFIQLWFSRLRPFLPAVSHDFLSCLITKGLNCSTYQHIVQILSHLQPHMTHPTQMSVYTHFIKVYLTMNTTGQGCVSNNSAEWLMKNLGRFSGMLSLRELLDLNPHFKPLEVLQLLTPKQTTELLVLIHPTLPDKDALINMIFDHFNQSPDKKKFTEFLSDLVMVLQKLSALKAEDLAAALACNRSYNSTSSRPVWKLFLSKASHVLDEALDLLANKTLDPRSPVVATILDSIREIRLGAFGPASFNNPAFIQLWFSHRLRPFLPAVSPDFLSCLTTKGLNCSTYQHIVQILSHLQPHMTLRMQMSVYTHFIKVYLTMKNATDPGCSLHTNDSGEWLQKNLGGFSALVSFYDLRMLYSNFSAMEALPYLTVRQIADVSATPGQLTSPKHVTMVMNHVPDQHLAAFFDDFSPAIMGQVNKFPLLVRSAFLQVVFDRANLSDHSVDDSDVLLWLRIRLRPLLVNLSPFHVAPFFAILAGRNCSIGQEGVQDLNSTIFSLSEVTQNEIHNHIIQSLRGPVPLRCYGDNYNHSFYSFLESSFLDFQFPNLTTFLSLMPHNKMHQLVNSMPPSHLGDFLRRPDVVGNDAELCVLYDNYMQIPVFLETESLPSKVRRSTLPCVWPRALSSSERSEVNAWFDQLLGEHNYTAADFMRQDVYSTIRTYLTSATVPRCYNASDPELNSTAWFAEYIGPFMPFLILEDLQAFGSAEVLKVFTVNPLNIDLLNHQALPLNLTNYYTELVYQQDSNFNPLLLPLLCRCVAPGLAFSQLDANESMIVLHNLTTLCTDLDPQISAALAANFGDQIDATTITSLGNESTGLSTGQIQLIKPRDLLAALGTLSSVTGWNGGQAKAIVLSLISSGMMQISSASSLFQLGSLVVGIPTSAFSNVNGSQLLTASKNPSFLQHLMSAPQIIQQMFVTQIISVNSNSETVIKNIPDDLATEIPRVLLLGFSNDTTVITTLNKKKWKKQQAELFFDVVGLESATTALGSANNLSSSVLQGFTCTGVRTIKKVQIKKLIKACRRKGKKKVKLVETQLTCMYNYIRIESDATSFDLYPPDMLLYYNYSLVPQASCRSYFEQIGDADFSIFSSTLNYKLTNLFANARSCLGITNTSLTEDNISVLGNMCCILGGFYIENSDPSILETLKTCPDLTNTQVAAVEARLQSGKTQYGAPSTWNLQTLKDLDMLPLYLTSSFYDNFDKNTKRQFLKYFLKVLRRNGVGKKKRRSLKSEIRKSLRKRSTRSIGNECTVGKITQVIISDEAFPFDYDDINQFNCCLSATIVKNNLASITDKVDQEEYLTIVLSKLREAYGSNSTIPESQVQLLGPASRVATTDDINSWTITQIDTLSALMDSSNGQWDPSLAKAIVTKYLSQEGNKLGSAELNAMGGTNLCSLDVDVLKSISQQSLKDAEALTLSNCTTEKHKALFAIARQAFGTDTRATTISTKSYQLTSSYLPGATLDYVRSLSASDVNMDMATFTSLDENVDLTVNEVKNLLGTNLPDLKSYEEQTLVQKWIRSQYQSELNTLGIGLQGGRADPATTAAATAATAATVAPVTTSLTTAGSGTGTTATTGTTGNGSRIRADPGFSLLVLLSLLIASLHFLV